MSEDNQHFWGVPVPTRGFSLIEPIVSELKYKKIERLRALEGYDKSERMIEIVKSSIRGSWALVFFDGYFADITPYGLSFHLFFSVMNEKPSHYLLHHPELKCSFLRNLFTGIETIVFKLCQMLVYENDTTYTFEREQISARVKKLKSHILVGDWEEYFALFDNILFVRNAFAHSFIRVEEIEYKTVPLYICFGEQFNRHMPPEAEDFKDPYFINEVKTFLQPLLDKFHELQMRQFDRDKLFVLCDRLLMERSLAR